jgi:hypothetical protein
MSVINQLTSATGSMAKKGPRHGEYRAIQGSCPSSVQLRKIAITARSPSDHIRPGTDTP